MVKVRWIGPHFFFVGAVLPERASEARPGGLPRLVVKLSQKPLAVPAFTVQNGRAKSWVTLCSTTVDRAEISRINGLRFIVALDLETASETAAFANDVGQGDARHAGLQIISAIPFFSSCGALDALEQKIKATSRTR